MRNAVASLNLLVLLSIILRVDGLLGNMTGTVYGGQVSATRARPSEMLAICAAPRFAGPDPAVLGAAPPHPEPPLMARLKFAIEASTSLEQ